MKTVPLIAGSRVPARGLSGGRRLFPGARAGPVGDRRFAVSHGGHLNGATACTYVFESPSFWSPGARIESLIVCLGGSVTRTTGRGRPGRGHPGQCRNRQHSSALRTPPRREETAPAGRATLC